MSMIGAAMSARETQLVAMLARGDTTGRAAHELGLSRHTVGEIISMLLARYNCSNRAALVAYCYVHHLLPLGVWPPPCTSRRGAVGGPASYPSTRIQGAPEAAADNPRLEHPATGTDG
ncbi:MAG TPA: helix-turn-helix transcriptional regulator [Jatrophihabitans sp.]|nr:helix-turn-helix transcriptional regulator [Jatrophihabitans sp.]